MTPQRAIRVFAAAITTATIAFSGATAAAQTPSPVTTSPVTPSPATTSLRQHALVKWRNGNSEGRDRSTFAIPGIGFGEIVCRADQTHIRIFPEDRTRETSMWSIIGQQKNGAPSWAVKNARVFMFSTPTTPLGSSGTGPDAQEGLNGRDGIEDSSNGVIRGVISQRTALNQPGAVTAASTSFAMTWRWSGFGGPVEEQRCKIEALFFTKLPAGAKVKTKTVLGVTRSPGYAISETSVDWHGEDDAALGKTEGHPAQLPYIGVLNASCPTGRDSAAAITLTADDPAWGLSVVVDRYEGEGPRATARLTFFSDPVTGVLRIPLPINGFLRLEVVGKGLNGAVIEVSSWRHTNDDKPAENFCEVVAQAVTATDAAAADDPLST